MVLGVQTHFSHGWPLSWLDEATKLGAPAIRDGLPWAATERSPGVYEFPPSVDAYLKAARAHHLRVVLAIVPSNPLYDNGVTVQSPAGMQAFAAFLSATVDRYGPTIEGVEIGNELNTKNGMTGLTFAERPAAYAKLLAAVYPAVKAKHPELKILGGSTNVVGVGFLASMFKAGALANMDAVVIHPYRTDSAGLDFELGRLDAAMAQSGGVKPIYATEFGSEFDDPERSPALLLKMAATMGAAHVAWASWYVLHDEPNYRNMGLVDADGHAKPAAAAFAQFEQTLAPFGDPQRVDTGDADTFAYRYGKTYVMWGAGQALAFSGKPHVRDSTGNSIPTPAALSERPIVVDGDFAVKFGADPVIADSVLEFGSAPWSYFARTADGVMHALSPVDWEWTSYIGGHGFRPLRIGADGVSPGGDQANPIAATERYTAAKSATLSIGGTFSVSAKSPGVKLSIAHNGAEIYAQPITTELTLAPIRASLKPGDTLDFSFSPLVTSSGAGTKVHIRLTQASAP